MLRWVLTVRRVWFTATPLGVGMAGRIVCENTTLYLKESANEDGG